MDGLSLQAVIKHARAAKPRKHLHRLHWDGHWFLGNIPLLVMAVLAVAVGVYTLWPKAPANTIFPPSVIASVDYPLYAPRTMPAGFSYDSASLSMTDQVVSYTLTYDTVKKLLVTEQPKPDNFDFDAFYMSKIDSVERFSVPIGRAAIGQYAGGHFGSIVTSRTWLILRAPAGIDTAEFKTLAASLR